MRWIATLLAALTLCCSGAQAQRSSSGVSKPSGYDIPPFTLNAQYINRQTAGLAFRSQTINPAQTTLVLIVAGQSNWTNINPTTYVPTNTSAIDQFNVYDGASYQVNGALLGTAIAYPLGSFGIGNLAARVADKIITSSASINRVILVPVAIGNTWIALWGSTGDYADRIPAAIRRLASKGITPSTPGVIFGMIWGQGESDTGLGTSQAAYAGSFAQIVANAQAAGFSGRIFICKETWGGGVTSSAVQAAQVAAVDNTTVFSGGDLDQYNSSNRIDNTHFNDTGAALVATTVFNAMHASGAPY